MKINKSQKERIKMLNNCKSILGVRNKSFDAESLQKIIITPVLDDIDEVIAVLSRVIYHPASEIDTDLRMEAYRVLHKHKMLQPLPVDKRQPKARK